MNNNYYTDNKNGTITKTLDGESYTYNILVGACDGILNLAGSTFRQATQKNQPCLDNELGRTAFLELVTGFEPATCSLRMSCTTNCATQANF